MLYDPIEPYGLETHAELLNRETGINEFQQSLLSTFSINWSAYIVSSVHEEIENISNTKSTGNCN